MHDIDLDEWDLIVTNGIHLIGKRSCSSASAPDKRVSPVLSLVYQPQFAQAPSGAVGVAHPMAATPFMGTGVPYLAIPQGALRIQLSLFSNSIDWTTLIEQGLAAQMQVRAKAAGLAIIQ